MKIQKITAISGNVTVEGIEVSSDELNSFIDTLDKICKLTEEIKRIIAFWNEMQREYWKEKLPKGAI